MYLSGGAFCVIFNQGILYTSDYDQAQNHLGFKNYFNSQLRPYESLFYLWKTVWTNERESDLKTKSCICMYVWIEKGKMGI